jgi:hypothetical protein
MQLERFHDWPVIDAKENRFFIRKIFVRMPLPQRNDEGISFLPFEVTLSHGRSALSSKDVVQRRAGVPMHFRFLVTLKELNLARHGWVGESARGGIDIAQQ